MEKQNNPRRFEMDLPGVPPLKMVLMHSADKKFHPRLAPYKLAPRRSPKQIQNFRAVVRLIEHLLEDEN